MTDSNIYPASPETIHRAARILASGGLVAFPTETVYGLGADARSPEALRRIFAAKGRPADHPLIVHLPDAGQLKGWAKDIPPIAEALANSFWPGPLTLILKRLEGVPDEVTGGQDTVGLRVPGHGVALELLQTFGSGIAAPSANRFGRISPTTAAHVASELSGRVDLILDGGACEVGLESTILDLSGNRPRLLRPGGISPAQLAEVLGEMPLLEHRDAPRAPGTLESHYAPTTPAYRVSKEELGGLEEPGHYGVLAWREETPATLHLPPEPEGYGRALYSSLRTLDVGGYRAILVEEVPETPEWLAVRDRLKRATLVPTAPLSPHRLD